MNSNGKETEPQVLIELDSPNPPIQEEEEELIVICDGSNPYKKVKLNMEEGPKKRKNDSSKRDADEEANRKKHGRTEEDSIAIIGLINIKPSLC